MLMLCPLKGKKKKNLSFNKLFCSVSMGLWQEAIRSETSRCIQCYRSLKKEKKTKGGERQGEVHSWGFFFPSNDGGCLLGGPLCWDGATGQGHRRCLESEASATLWSHLHLLSLFHWKLVKPSRLSHMYEIQGSYFLFFRKNDPFGLEGPLVWTKTLGRDEREEKSAGS